MTEEYTMFDFWGDYYEYLENRPRWQKILSTLSWCLVSFIMGFAFTWKFLSIM